MGKRCRKDLTAARGRKLRYPIRIARPKLYLLMANGRICDQRNLISLPNPFPSHVVPSFSEPPSPCRPSPSRLLLNPEWISREPGGRSGDNLLCYTQRTTSCQGKLQRSRFTLDPFGGIFQTRPPRSLALYCHACLAKEGSERGGRRRRNGTQKSKRVVLSPRCLVLALISAC
jgi:hypothetical protein